VESLAQKVVHILEALLVKPGADFNKVLKCSFSLHQMDDFGVVNEIYGDYFGENPPARETVAVDTLPKRAKVEISCVAFVG
jgi:2-iminobutanoate/2-iminopropanoate deaminase